MPVTALLNLTCKNKDMETTEEMEQRRLLVGKDGVVYVELEIR